MAKVQLPQDYKRVADAFTGLPDADKARIISHLESQPDPGALDKTVTQIIHNGGPEADLVGRIFGRAANPATGQQREGIRTVHNKPAEPIQKKDAGTGQAGAGELQTEEPHTSTVNPPSVGHEGRTVAQPGAKGDERSLNENARVSPAGKVTQEDRPPARTPAPTSTRPASSSSEE